MRADRLVSLALLLQARGRMSARGLAAELEVSVRTVYRDIAALNAAGVPVVTESGPGGGCWLLDGYRFPLRGLTGDEAEALLVLGVPAVVAELGLADALAAAQQKIRVTTGASGASGASGALGAGHGAGGGAGPGGGAGAGGGAGPVPALVHLDPPRWFVGGEPVPWLRTLATAVRGRRLLRIGYRRGDRDGIRGAESSRVVGPLGLVNKAGIWYLVATAAAAAPSAGDAAGDTAGGTAGGTAGRDPAVFRVGRVSTVAVLPQELTRPPDFDLASFWAQWSASFMTSRPRLDVRVRASADALAVFPEVFGDAVRPALDAAPPADGRGFREVALTFEHEAAAVQRLSGFGGELEVLSPPDVRARLIATARALLRRYEADG